MVSWVENEITMEDLLLEADPLTLLPPCDNNKSRAVVAIGLFGGASDPLSKKIAKDSERV